MPEWSGPGFVDLQVNGFAGVDYNATTTTPDDVVRSLEAMEATGVGLCLPTIITSSYEHFAACARVVNAAGHPAVAGIHMEGPYISATDGFRGAHPLADVRPATVDDFERRQDAADGHIRLVTLAPEVPGAIGLIDHLVARGIRVALGHTNASTQELDAAAAAGATLATHLGNGCPVQLPRHPNVIWDQLADDRLLASLIVDGHHLPASTVRVMIRAKGPSRCLLVTDAVMAAGSAPGRYRLAGLDVELSPSGRVAAPGSATLAGSSLRMDHAVQLTSEMTGLPIADVLPLASTQPAAYLGVPPRGQVTLTRDEAGHWRTSFKRPT
jgi:N-acetylglucosamine-6-phosphate deacetylase